MPGGFLETLQIIKLLHSVMKLSSLSSVSDFKSTASFSLREQYGYKQFDPCTVRIKSSPVLNEAARQEDRGGIAPRILNISTRGM
jgi:hypothetical protein